MWTHTTIDQLWSIGPMFLIVLAAILVLLLF
jgi:hypothetical protein